MAKDIHREVPLGQSRESSLGKDNQQKMRRADRIRSRLMARILGSPVDRALKDETVSPGPDVSTTKPNSVRVVLGSDDPPSEFVLHTSGRQILRRFYTVWCTRFPVSICSVRFFIIDSE
jgi:hypothetical protein